MAGFCASLVMSSVVVGVDVGVGVGVEVEVEVEVGVGVGVVESVVGCPRVFSSKLGDSRGFEAIALTSVSSSSSSSSSYSSSSSSSSSCAFCSSVLRRCPLRRRPTCLALATSIFSASVLSCLSDFFVPLTTCPSSSGMRPASRRFLCRASAVRLKSKLMSSSF